MLTTAPTATARADGPPPTALQPPPYTAIDEFTRDAVREVFDKMLGMEMTEVAPREPEAERGDQIIGSVGFVGTASGVIHLQSGSKLARFMTARLLGLQESNVETDMINDALGEVTNMVVGSVKSRLCDAGWPCVLTIPSITRGSGLRMEPIANVTRNLLPYYSSGCRLLVEVNVKGAVA